MNPSEAPPTFPAGVPIRDALSANQDRGEVLIITGMSGAGRTQAAGVLEDLGWYVVDNLPPQMIEPLAGMMTPAGSGVKRLAVVVDVRSGEFFRTLMGALESLRAAGVRHRIVFLDASDSELIRRYESVRRPHPLQGAGSVLTGIGRERELLADLREQADDYIDTSAFTVHELAAHMSQIADPGLKDEVTVSVSSFGFKYGLPADASAVLDVRFLANPYWVDELRHLTGVDPAVRDYVMASGAAQEFLDHYVAALMVSLDGFVRQRKRHLSVAVGCTGGKHRSVAMTEALVAMLRERGVRARASHRDVGRE
ncbi:MAG: RNase adapter RapZ [Bifidobacteriaceae bacterium]|nr:RNase adapter RapZ [Bifidobacteriaceae bacterium]